MTDNMMRVAGRGNDGTAKPLKTDNDGNQIVKSMEQVGKDFIGKRIANAYETGAKDRILELNEPLIVDYLEWSTNDPRGQITIFYYSEEDVSNPDYAIGLASNDGTDTQPLRPENIGVLGAGPFEIVEHNTTMNRYKYRLKEKMFFPTGAIIELRNRSSSDANIAVSLLGRVLN